MDDALLTLARAVVPHLAPNERAQVTMRNLTALSAAEATRAQVSLDLALRRNIRNPVMIKIDLTISDNLQGYLLVAEIQHENEKAVEMASFRPPAAPEPARASIGIERKLVWQQDTPILDVYMAGFGMLVLDATGVTYYERQEGKLEKTVHIDGAFPSIRDMRGRLESSGAILTVTVPGLSCHGGSDKLECEVGGFLAGGRNTLARTADLPDHYSGVRLGDQLLLAETDGRARLYDSSHKLLNEIEGWGSDLVSPPESCGTDLVLATTPGDANSVDSVSVYRIANNQPTRVSDPLGFPGPITALWEAFSGREQTGARAVTHNLSTGRYEAYSITLDCGR